MQDVNAVRSGQCYYGSHDGNRRYAIVDEVMHNIVLMKNTSFMPNIHTSQEKRSILGRA